MNKLNQNNLFNKYKDNQLLIIGLNDSQGVDTTFKIKKKSFMFYIEKNLKKANIKYEIIDCFSLFFNKIHYIDLFFKHDIDKKSIRLLQIYGNIMALTKCMIDYHLPVFISKIRNVYRLTYKKVRKNINITEELIKSKNPIVIYSSGSNDLMQIIGTDPLSVIKHYKTRNKRPNFYYSVNKAKNLKIVDDIIIKIESNLKNIYSYNNNCTIVIIGSYIPYSLKREEMKDFIKLINKYNSSLELLCKKYNAIYIDTNDIGSKYNKKEYNFHISTKGHKQLAKIILEEINRKCMVVSKTINFKNNEFDDTGIDGIINDLNSIIVDYEEKRKEKNSNEDTRNKEILKEYLNEIEVLKYVSKKLR